MDVIALKSSLLSDLYLNGQEALRQKDEQVKKLQKELATKNAIFEKADDISAELRAQHPAVISMIISEGVELLPGSTKRQLIQLNVKSLKPFSSDDKVKIENWFKARTKTDAVVLSFVSEGQKTRARKSAKTGRTKSR